MTSVQVETAVLASEGERQGLCVVCTHQLAEHDRISHRFCEATQTQALTRNCICPKKA